MGRPSGHALSLLHLCTSRPHLPTAVAGGKKGRRPRGLPRRRPLLHLAHPARHHRWRRSATGLGRPTRRGLPARMASPALPALLACPAGPAGLPGPGRPRRTEPHPHRHHHHPASPPRRQPRRSRRQNRPGRPLSGRGPGLQGRPGRLRPPRRPRPPRPAWNRNRKWTRRWTMSLQQLSPLPALLLPAAVATRSECHLPALLLPAAVAIRSECHLRAVLEAWWHGRV